MTLTLLLTMLGAWGYWSVSSVPGGGGAGGGGVVGQGSTPTATVSGSSVTLSWTATPLANGQSADGYIVRRYASGTLAEQTVLTGCTGTVAATTCTETSVPDGLWLYSVTPTVGANWRGTESVKSSTVRVDTVPPGSSIAVTNITGGVYRTGTTIWYRGAAVGSFRLTNTVTDAGSGPASSETAALSGTFTGLSHTPSKVSSPAGGPYVSNPFSWTAGASGSPTETVTSRDESGNATTTTFRLSDDSTAPSAGSISYATASSGTSVTVTFTSGTDADSGIASRKLERAHADYEDGACSDFSAFRQVGSANPASPYIDTTLGNATCYKYRYVVSDRVGNQAVASSADVVTSDYSAAVKSTPGLLSHWRFGESYSSIDSFTDSPRRLTAHDGEVGAGWAQFIGSTVSQITDAGRVRRRGGGVSLDLASGRPPTPDYSVEADLFNRALLADDAVGVVGRLDTADSNFYVARYEEADDSWNLLESVGGNLYYRDYESTQPLAAGETSQLRLEMTGSVVRVYVDDVLKLYYNDPSPITAAGRAGILDAPTSGTSVKSDTTGIHLDNFAVRSLRAIDSKGSNNGRYGGGVTVGVAGALDGDANTAAFFDGSNDFMQVGAPTGVPVGATARSVEMWFKTTSTARQTLFEYGSMADTRRFGLLLKANENTMIAWGYGAGNDKEFTLASSVTDGAWHHVVVTYDGTTLTLYVDGVALPTQTAVRDTLMGSTGFGVGAVVESGHTYSGGFFRGAIDEVSLYSSVLDQAAVTQRFQLAASAPTNSTGPAGGSVEATGLAGTGSRYSTSTTVSLALATGTDSDGIAPTGARLLRASAPLTSADYANGSCGGFSSFGRIANDPAATMADTVASGFCYRYRYVVPDTLSNDTTYRSGVVKVDTSAPNAPTLSFGNFVNTAVTGTTVYYRPAQSTGQFRISGASTDAESGVDDVNFPALGTNWTSTSAGVGATTYAWSGAPAAPGIQQLTATNHAGAKSGGTSFTMVADDAGPTGGSLTVPNATTSSTSVSISFTSGTDSGSGIGNHQLQRASAPLSGSTCGTYSDFATVTSGTNATSPFTDTVTRGQCHQYRYVVDDRLGNQTVISNANVVKVLTYAGTVSATSGLIRYWRMGESLITDDDLTGTTGAVLNSADWAKHSLSDSDMVFAAGDAIRKSGTSTAKSLYTSTDVHDSANYTIEADVLFKSSVTGDMAGVVGRVDTANANGTFYIARYEVAAGAWRLYKVVNGTWTQLGTQYAQALTAGSRYRVGLEMYGTSIRLLVNGVVRVSAADSAISATGRSGVAFGFGPAATTITDTTGMHIERVRVSPPMADVTNAGAGLYRGGARPSRAGAITGDSNTSVEFDANPHDRGFANGVALDNLSQEFWFRSSAGTGTSAHWHDGGALVTTDVITSGATDWGVSLRSDGKIVAGVGSPSTSVESTAGGYNNGAWHHVVFTWSSTGELRLYVDGSQVASTTGGPTAQRAVNSGIFMANNPDGTKALNTHLDEVALYNTVLTPAQVSGHYVASQ